MYFDSSAVSMARSLAFAVGLTSLGGCATSHGLMPPTDQPGLTVVPDRYADINTRLLTTMESAYHVSGLRLEVTDSFLADLNGDGSRDDLAGSALLQYGRRFKSFIFLTTADGATRFLEANGGRFDPSAGGAILSCSSKPIACPDTLDRARAQIEPARFSLSERDSAQAGPELAFRYGDGSLGILNSLSLFRSE